MSEAMENKPESGAQQNEEKKDASGKARIQFDFSKESLAKLDELMKSTSAHSRAEVIRKALTLLNVVLDAERRGGQLMLKEPNGEIVRIMTLL